MDTFAVKVVLGLVRMAVESYRLCGQHTLEYKTLYNAAKVGLDQLMPDPTPATTAFRVHDDNLAPNEIQLGMKAGKVHAIKAYKDRTRLSLMDSKNDVQSYFEAAGLTFKGYEPARGIDDAI